MKLLHTKRTQIDIYHTLRKIGGFAIFDIDWDFESLNLEHFVRCYQTDIRILCFIFTVYWE